MIKVMNKGLNLKGHLNFIESFTFYPLFLLFGAFAGEETKPSGLYLKGENCKTLGTYW